MAGGPRLVVFSDDWGRHPSSSQHLVTCLLDRLPTLWVNTIGTRPPGISLDDIGKVAGKLKQWLSPARQDDHLPDNLTVVSPKMWPGFRRGWQRRFNGNRIAREVNRALGGGRADFAVTTLPITADLVGRINVDRWMYYCVDDFSVWPGLDGGVMRDMEQQLVERVDQAVAVSPHLADHLAKLGKEAMLLTHGIDLDLWVTQTPKPSQSETEAQKPVNASLPDWWPRDSGSIVLFWGLIDRRLDCAWCQGLLERNDLSLVLVGPEQNPDPALNRLARLVRPGPVDMRQLPALAAAADVLVMPYQDLPVTRAMQPLKFKEYLATGKPVVARNLPAARPWQDAADLVDTRKDFVERVMERTGLPLPQGQAQARKRLANESWANKAQQLLEALLEGEQGRKLDPTEHDTS